MAKIESDKLNLVKKLYYEDGFSASQIAKTLGVSLDSTYYFMRRNDLKRRLASESNNLIWQKKLPSYVLNNKLGPKAEQLKNIGVTLYWGEGYKAESACGVDFANSDIEMIKVFMRFLREICGIREDRLRIYLYCYSNQKPLDLIKFWSRITKVSPRQFSRPYIRTDFVESKKAKMPHGMIHVRYGDKKLLRQILKWIDDCKQDFA
ncbi:MAG: hypothetical protein A2556_02320 [Candidatus Vogelbacteria bacterium RIFOXYD2_FULL_44_9]|uniref:RNA polymerase sigma factor 70 region 4 type 2 domain-containing protein n=1 Tax=Candidatus Vogelbacteria bacterium RIFOXYD2_FULL_44_9 TaxID=1802441 RepID=A0A1G2QN81_9BACT|nr:MAG: hypothetical protein A2556_02320 [Candidatus Vogelbacteria bacterium RIFOXYD2_FULL_44_9]